MILRGATESRARARADRTRGQPLGVARRAARADRARWRGGPRPGDWSRRASRRCCWCASGRWATTRESSRAMSGPSRSLAEQAQDLELAFAERLDSGWPSGAGAVGVTRGGQESAQVVRSVRAASPRRPAALPSAAPRRGRPGRSPPARRDRRRARATRARPSRRPRRAGRVPARPGLDHAARASAGLGSRPAGARGGRSRFARSVPRSRRALPRARSSLARVMCSNSRT